MRIDKLILIALYCYRNRKTNSGFIDPKTCQFDASPVSYDIEFVHLPLNHIE